MSQITFTTHSVQLDPPATKLTNSVLYQAGPKARDFKKNKFDNMLLINLTDPAQTWWASSISFAGEKAELSNFAWIITVSMPLQYEIITAY